MGSALNENDIMKLIQIEFSKLGHRLFRNNTGALKDEKGRWVHFGLCEGSSDLIGWSRTGRFMAVEVKRPGAWTKPERLQKQHNFLAVIIAAGGIGIMAESVEDALRDLELFR